MHEDTAQKGVIYSVANNTIPSYCSSAVLSYVDSTEMQTLRPLAKKCACTWHSNNLKEAPPTPLIDWLHQPCQHSLT